jgi:nitrite reductase (NADH) small subunit
MTMHRDPQLANWTAVCRLDEIVPDTGVCALLGGRQVAVFRIGDIAPRVFAIDNYDPNSQALARAGGQHR